MWRRWIPNWGLPHILSLLLLLKAKVAAQLSRQWGPFPLQTHRSSLSASRCSIGHKITATCAFLETLGLLDSPQRNSSPQGWLRGSQEENDWHLESSQLSELLVSRGQRLYWALAVSDWGVVSRLTCDSGSVAGEVQSWPSTSCTRNKPFSATAALKSARRTFGEKPSSTVVQGGKHMKGIPFSEMWSIGVLFQ